MHESFVILARRLITANGREITLVTLTGEGKKWDPQNVKRIKKSVIGVQTNFKSSEIDGRLILSTDKAFLIETDEPPILEMRVIDSLDGIEHSLVSFTTIAPGTTSIIYKLQVRR